MAEGSCDGALEKIGRDFLTCSLCLSYYKNAKSLPCLHSYCEGCLVTLVEKRGELVCPECRQHCDIPEEGVSQLGNNFVLNGLIDFIKAQEFCATDSGSRSSPCESCGVNIVTCRCVNCAINICQNCRKCHTSFPALKTHRLIAISEYTAVGLEPYEEQVAAYKPPQYCTVNGHEDKVLKFYCRSESCQLPICLECTVVNHRAPEHEHQYLTEKADEVRNQLKENGAKLETKVKGVTERLDTARKELISVEKAYEDEVLKVKKQIETVIEMLKKYEEMLLAELKKAHESLTKYLDCEVDRYELVEKNINSTATYLDVLLNYGDAVEIVTGAKQTENPVNQLLGIDLEHHLDIALPCFQPVHEIDMNAIVGQLRTVYGSTTTGSKIPKYAVVGETIRFSVTTNDMNGVPALTNHLLQPVNITIDGPNGEHKEGVMTTESNGATHTTEIKFEEEGKHSISITVGNAPIPGAPFAVAVLSDGTGLFASKTPVVSSSYGMPNAYGAQTSIASLLGTLTTTTSSTSGSLFSNPGTAFRSKPTQQTGTGLFASKTPVASSSFGMPNAHGAQTSVASLFRTLTTTTSATSGSLFSNTCTAFGSKPTQQSTYGGLAGQGSSITTTAFGQTSTAQTGLFGTGGFAGNAPQGTTIKFMALHGTDTMLKAGVSSCISTRHQCITAMKEYESKSLEELRFEDYVANRKVQGTAIGLLGQVGLTQSKTGGLFGQTSTGSSHFGQKPFGTGTYGGLPGQGSSIATTAFGQTSTAETGLFGTGGFAGNAPQGTTIKFKALRGTDTMLKAGLSSSINTRHQCITAMKEYESKSLEELRFEDYVANRKAQGTAIGLLGQGGLTKNKTGGLFGQTSTGSSLFVEKPFGTGFSPPAANPFTSGSTSRVQRLKKIRAKMQKPRS